MEKIGESQQTNLRKFWLTERHKFLVPTKTSDRLRVRNIFVKHHNTKNKEKILQASKHQVTYKGTEWFWTSPCNSGC